MRRVLIVKTSSMGDVVHALPAVSDMVAQLPGLQVDWLVEAPFAALPALHPGVQQVLPLAWRKWRRHLGERSTWQAIGQLRQRLQQERYDRVLDLQGLLKSAMWGLQARGPMAGYDRHSIREPLAALFYRHTAAVPRSLHAVARCRQLAAATLGYALPDSAPDFGIRPASEAAWHLDRPYAVLIPCASRPEKLWPEADWTALGRGLAARGWTPLLLWGNAEEKARAERIAAACGGVLPPFLTVKDTAAVLGAAVLAVGLDTGFSHLAAALGVPTLGIYCDHEPGLAGITGPSWVRSIGGKGQRPSLPAVQALVDEQVAVVLDRG